jgi:hypothetical protein
MGEKENFNIIETENKVYDICNTDEAINFLIYALSEKYYRLFIDFVFRHIGIDIYKYSWSFFELQKSNSIFEVQRDALPFFDFILEDFHENNIFFKYIYFSSDSDLLKKQKISKLVASLEKTLEHYFDFHSVSIYWNCEIDKDYDFIKKTSIENGFCLSYTYYCICKILINYYDYLYQEFYIFIDNKNSFKIKYSNKIKEIRKEVNKIGEISKSIKKTRNWHLVFNEILNGKIKIIDKLNNQQYFYDNQEFKNPTQLGEFLAKKLGKNETTIRLILTQSLGFVNKQEKNIFCAKNKIELKELMQNNENNMCEFFKRKLDELNLVQDEKRTD